MIDLPDAAGYDAAVGAMDGIDRWCSSTDWTLPLTASMGARTPFVIRTASGWGLFDRAVDREGAPVILGVDRIWGFATAVVGPPDAWFEVAEVLADEDWQLVLLPGLVEESESWHAAAEAFSSVAGAELFRVGGITRRQADLSGGTAAWLDRRSARFRRSLAAARRRSGLAGLRVVEVDAIADGGDLIDRLVAIEATSWKGAQHDGLCAPEFADFYRLVTARLSPGGRVRVLIAELGGRPAGYILGGVRDGTYRGLQLSFAQDHADLSIGHVLQAEQIDRLVAEGVHTYDLGMDIEYKRRWSDTALTTAVIAVRRPR